jgi:hypothetical protein
LLPGRALLDNMRDHPAGGEVKKVFDDRVA